MTFEECVIAAVCTLALLCFSCLSIRQWLLNRKPLYYCAICGWQGRESRRKMLGETKCEPICGNLDCSAVVLQINEREVGV